MQSDLLKDKNIIITGGSSGIGETLAYGLSSLGANVILVSRSVEKMQNSGYFF